MTQSEPHPELRFAALRKIRSAFKPRASKDPRPSLSVVLLLLLSSIVALAQSGPSRSGDVQDHLQKAEAYLKARDPDSAAREFNAVLALDPRNAEAFANLGVIAFFRRDCPAAAKDFRKALASNPALEKTRALLGVCEKRSGDPDARATLERSFQKLNDKQLRLQVGLELASLYQELGDSGATASIMRSLVDLYPDNVDVLFMAQRFYSELADDTLNKLAVLAPESARMQQVIAQHLVNQGDLQNAIPHYRKALQLDPRVSGVHFELGEAILQLSPADAGAQAEAQKDFESAIAVNGDSAGIECALASIALSQSQRDDALAHYRRAYQLNPNDVQAQLGLARLVLQQKPQEAIQYLRKAVRQEPLNGTAHYRLARAYRDAGMTEQSERELDLFQEIKKTKDQVEALYHEMNRQPKPEPFEIPDRENSEAKP